MGKVKRIARHCSTVWHVESVLAQFARQFSPYQKRYIACAIDQGFAFNHISQHVCGTFVETSYVARTVTVFVFKVRLVRDIGMTAMRERSHTC
jgi:hypothetical protein